MESLWGKRRALEFNTEPAIQPVNTVYHMMVRWKACVELGAELSDPPVNTVYHIVFRWKAFEESGGAYSSVWNLLLD